MYVFLNRLNTIETVFAEMNQIILNWRWSIKQRIEIDFNQITCNREKWKFTMQKKDVVEWNTYSNITPQTRFKLKTFFEFILSSRLSERRLHNAYSWNVERWKSSTTETIWSQTAILSAFSYWFSCSLMMNNWASGMRVAGTDNEHHRTEFSYSFIDFGFVCNCHAIYLIFREIFDIDNNASTLYIRVNAIFSSSIWWRQQ